jgi:fatty-acyl-CoA synthase
MNLGEWVTKRAELYPKRPFLKAGGLALTNVDFNTRMNATAAALVERGVEKGDRVVALMENGAAFVDLLFACARLGAILVPVNPHLATGEIDHILADSEPLLVLYSRSHGQIVQRLAFSLQSPRRVMIHAEVAEKDLGDQLVDDGALEKAETFIPQSPPQENDPLILMYTSGTTGTPKGALLSHRNLLFGAIHSLLAYGLGPECRSLVVAPLFHIGALGASVTPVVYAGGSLVLEDFERPADTLQTLMEEKITYMFAVPVMFEMMARSGRWETADFSRVDFFIAGGAPMPVDLIHRYQREKGISFAQGYGMTETLRITNLDLADAYAKAGSIGKAAFHTEVKLVDDEGCEVPAGQPGEIIVRGPTVFGGYWRQPVATGQVLKEGWFSTGDLAHRDAAGFLYIVGRKSEVIICSGKNIYAAEVEQALRRLPAVAAAAVVGRPDRRRGEIPEAFVELAEDVKTITAADLLAQLEPHLAAYKIPRRIHVVDRLPRGKSGKILKNALKERSAST